MLNPAHARIWACAQPTSMRMSFDGLRGTAIRALGRDPNDGDLFLFVAKNRKQARVLFWDGTGFVVYAKRLSQGRFNAPWEGPATKPWQLSGPELALFLEGSRLVGRQVISPPRVVPQALG